MRSGQYDPYGKPLTLNTIRAPKALRSNPTVPHSSPQQLGSLIVANVRADPLDEGKNIYKLLGYRATLKIKNFFTAIKGHQLMINSVNLFTSLIHKTL